jgi:predicted DNA-binding protein YlxM (UPF0122 family)
MTDQPHAIIDSAKGKIDIGKAIKLRYVKGNSLTEIGKVFNCSRQAVSQALMPYDALFKDGELLSVYKANQEQIMEGVLAELTANILDKGKLKKASLNNVAYSFDIFFKNLRLLQEKSTVNQSTIISHESDLADVEARIAELEGRTVAGQSPEDIIDAEIAALEDESE